MPLNKNDAFYQVFIDRKNEAKKELTKKIGVLTSRLKVEMEKNAQLAAVDTTQDEAALNRWSNDREKAFTESQKKIFNQEEMIARMEENYERERVRLQRQIDALSLKQNELKAVHDDKVSIIRRQVTSTTDHMEKSLSFFDNRIKSAKERIDQAISSKNPLTIKMGLELKELEAELEKTNRCLAEAWISPKCYPPLPPPRVGEGGMDSISSSLASRRPNFFEIIF